MFVEERSTRGASARQTNQLFILRYISCDVPELFRCSPTFMIIHPIITFSGVVMTLQTKPEYTAVVQTKNGTHALAILFAEALQYVGVLSALIISLSEEKKLPLAAVCLEKLNK